MRKASVLALAAASAIAGLAATDGFVKAVIGRKGRILGATIVGRHAGELILPWVLAV